MLTARILVSRGDFRLDAEFAFEGLAASLLGPSGAGKTTLLHAIAGLVRPDEGEIRLGDRVLFRSSDGTHLPPERRRVGLVYQDGLLFPHLTVERNLRFGWRRRARGERRIDPDRVIDLLELRSLLDRSPRGLSGGERQRVALGRVLLSSPELLLLDEPLASLDVGLRRRILPYLVAVKEELGIPALYVTHVVSEALRMAETVVVLDGGRVVGAGPFHEVLAEPGVFAVARRLGLDNVVPAVVEGVDEAGGTILAAVGSCRIKAPPANVSVGRRIFLTVRADEILLARSAPTGLSARNVLPGVVSGLEPVGDRVLVRLDAGFPLTVEVTPEAARDLGLAVGEAVFVVVKTHSFRVVPA